ncbi:MAG: tetratricopeptide repeat protein [Caulobacteraceae bacterium]|nr:tetratricopeptide repeat protein [Caulobacteraceae bacterium]
MAAGLERHQAGLRDEAERLYAQALDRDPQEATGLYLLGLLAFETGRPQQAAVLLQRVCDLRPRNLDARFTLAGVRHWLGEHAAACEAYRGVLAREPDHAGALVGLANALRDGDDIDGALAAAREAAARHPQLAAAQSALAASLAADGQSLAAADAWREAIRLDPAAPAAHVGLALALLQGERAQAAHDAAERALALDPGLAEAWFARGAALSALHRHLAAVEALERSIDLDSSRAAAHLALGAAYAELDRAAEAERRLRQAIALDPMMSEAHASLGAIYLKADRPDAALDCYEIALVIDPDMVAAHQNLAALLAEAGDATGARRHRDRAYGRQNLFVEPAPDPLARVLILTTAEGGNTPFRHLAPKDRYTRINWFVEYATPGQAADLPEHDVVFNAIGDQDLAGPTAANVEAFMAVSDRPLLNHPAKVARTARDRTPELLGGIPDVVAPRTVRVSAGQGSLAEAMEAAGLRLPVLVRPIGSHGGKGLVLADTRRALDQAAPPAGEAVYLTAFRDFRSPDGYYRKYRMIFVDGRAYPYHLAISPLWLVHHGTAGMARDPARIAEELAFLRDPTAAIGERALAAVRAIGERLGLDYAGLDFSVLPDGQVLVFEANATMLVHPEAPSSPFAHKNPYVTTILDAFQAMLARR